MKRNIWIRMLLAPLAVGLLFGCSKDPSSFDLDSDEEAIRALIEENEDYFTTAGINDDGAQPLVYSIDGFGKTANLIDPLRFGRKGRFQLEHLSIDRVDDSTLVATIIKSFNGNFLILASDTTDSVAQGILYTKDMENEIVRKAIFKKRGNSGDRRKDWKLRRVSGSETQSPETTLSFVNITIQNSDGQEWSIEDPLEFFRDLEAIPTLQPGDSVKVFAKINNSSPYLEKPGETVSLRYKNDRRMRRARKGLNDDGVYPDEATGDGTYSGYWVVGQRRGIYHAFVDAIDNGTIYDDQLQYNSKIWGFTYIVK